MLIAFVLLAAIEAGPSPTVTLVLTRAPGATPVDAAPRTLSDVARELREGRKGTASFSAVETTVTHPAASSGQPYRREIEREPESEPEVVVAQPPAYVQTYIPSGYGGSLPPRRFRPRASFQQSASATGAMRRMAAAGGARRIR